MAGVTKSGISKKATLINMSLSAFVTSYIYSSINVALPAIGKEFSMEATLLGWVANAAILATAVVLIPTGRLADIYGRKKVFVCGLFVFMLASILCGISNSAIFLVLSRVLQGIGAAIMIGISQAIVASVFLPQEFGRALGITVGTVYAGLSAGPFLGGVLTEHLGWRSIFWLAALMCLIVIGLTLWKLRAEWVEAKREKFDIIGAAIFIVALSAIMYGFTALPTVLGIVLILVGILGLVMFARWEDRAESPVLSIDLFRGNPVFLYTNLATLVNYIATYAVILLLSLYLQYNKGFSPQTAGLILLIQPLLVCVFSPIGGRLSDRIEPRIIASVGMALNCVALIPFIFLTNETALWIILASLVIYGIGLGLYVSPSSNAIMGSVPKKFLGIASGMQGTTRNTGMVLSIGIAMILFSIYIGNAQITPEYYPAFLKSLQVGFTIFTILCFGGIFLQFAGKATKRMAEVKPVARP